MNIVSTYPTRQVLLLVSYLRSPDVGLRFLGSSGLAELDDAPLTGIAGTPRGLCNAAKMRSNSKRQEIQAKGPRAFSTRDYRITHRYISSVICLSLDDSIYLLRVSYRKFPFSFLDISIRQAIMQPNFWHQSEVNQSARFVFETTLRW